MEIRDPDADGETTGSVAVVSVAAGEPDPLVVSVVGTAEHATRITRPDAATILRMPDVHLETSGSSSINSAGDSRDLVPLSMRAPIAVKATSSSLTPAATAGARTAALRPERRKEGGIARGNWNREVVQL
jgi:hypothetical protein